MAMSNQSAVVILLAAAVILAGMFVLQKTETNLTIMKAIRDVKLSDLMVANTPDVKLSPAVQESINADRSRFDPLVKAFFQQQQASRQQTLQLADKEGGFHFLYNAVIPEVNCPRLIRVGNTDDGGKWICDPWQLPSDCLVYSSGVGGDVTFERELNTLIKLRCNIFCFDPNPNYATLVADVPRGAFNAWRLAQVDNPQQGTRSVRGIMQLFGHRFIDIFKVDVDNAEHDIMPELLASNQPIACQILIEIHGESSKHVKLLEVFAKAGFLLFSYEVNGYSMDACEYSLIHRSCMQRYGINDVLHKLFKLDRKR